MRHPACLKADSQGSRMTSDGASGGGEGGVSFPFVSSRGSCESCETLSGRGLVAPYTLDRALVNLPNQSLRDRAATFRAVSLCASKRISNMGKKAEGPPRGRPSREKLLGQCADGQEPFPQPQSSGRPSGSQAGKVPVSTRLKPLFSPKYPQSDAVRQVPVNLWALDH